MQVYIRNMRKKEHEQTMSNTNIPDIILSLLPLFLWFIWNVALMLNFSDFVDLFLLLFITNKHQSHNKKKLSKHHKQYWIKKSFKLKINFNFNNIFKIIKSIKNWTKIQQKFWKTLEEVVTIFGNWIKKSKNYKKYAESHQNN